MSTPDATHVSDAWVTHANIMYGSNGNADLRSLLCLVTYFYFTNLIKEMYDLCIMKRQQNLQNKEST